MWDVVRQGRNDILAGSAAGSACKLVEYPLDTIKVQMQTAGSGTSLSNLGPIGLLRMNVREHGFRRLYQGISSPLVGSMAENATLFVSFNLAQSLCHDGPKESMPVYKLVACAMASGVAVSTVLTPVELIKCRMQTLAANAVRAIPPVHRQDLPPYFSSTAVVDANPALASPRQVVYKSTLDCLARTVREEGVAHGLFKGHVSTLMRELPGNVSWFGGNLLLPHPLSLSVPLHSFLPAAVLLAQPRSSPISSSFSSSSVVAGECDRAHVLFATQGMRWGATC